MDEVSCGSLQKEDGDAQAHDIRAPSETDHPSLHQGTDDDCDKAEKYLGLSQPANPVGGLSLPLQHPSSPRSQRKNDCDEESHLNLFGAPNISPRRASLGSQRSNLGKNPDDSSKSGAWKKRMYEYCQGASIHGLKQITEPQPLKSRRSEFFLLPI